MFAIVAFFSTHKKQELEQLNPYKVESLSKSWSKLLQKSLRLLEGTKKVVVGKIMKDVDKMKDGTQKKTEKEENKI